MIKTYCSKLMLFFCITFCMDAYANSHIVNITIPGPLDGNKVRNPFVEDLLHLVFKKNKLELNLKYHTRTYTQGRALRELSLNKSIDLNWSTTSIDREKLLRPIKIPIYKGLIGWRVLLIREADQPRFNEINTLKQLRPLIAVQRYDWTDFDILEENHMQVEGNLSFSKHSKALVDGYVDYFPRSVLEVNREIKQERNKGLVVESRLLLKYPSAYYFFVSKENESLAKLVEAGLEKAKDDGSFDKLFMAHFGEQITSLKLKERHVIKLTNSSIPQLSNLDDERYWYQH